MGVNGSGPSRAARRIFVLLAFAIGTATAWELCVAILPAHGPFLWDPANHGVTAVRLAQSLEHGRVFEFLRDVNGVRHWPFLHPLLLAIVMLFAGTGYGVAIAFSSAALAALCALLAFAVSEADDDGPYLAPLVSVALLSAPLVLQFGGHVMLEIFCALASLVCLLAYARFARAPSRRRAWGVAIATTSLCFLKYNYAAFWGIALVACEIGRLGPEWRRGLFRWARGWVSPEALRCPTFWIVMAILGLIAWIRVTGGWKGEVFGHRLTITTTGNPIFALLLVISARVVWELIRRGDAWRARLPEEVWVFLVGTMAPLAVWFLVLSPTRVKEFVDWLTSGTEGSRRPWLHGEGAYLPRVIEGFAPVAWVRVLAAIGFLAGLVRAVRGGWDRRAPVVWFAIGAAGCLAHPYKDTRFLVPLAPAFWAIAASGLCGLVGLVGRAAARRGILVVASAAVLAAWVPWYRGWLHEDLPSLVHSMYGDRSLLATVDQVASACSGARHVAIFGDVNQLSHHAIEWAIRRTPGGHNVKFESRRKRVKPPKTGAPWSLDPAAALAYWLERTRADTVVSIEVPVESPYYASIYPKADVGLVRELERQIVFRKAATLVDPDSRFILRVYRR